MQVIIYSRLSHPSALPNFLLAFSLPSSFGAKKECHQEAREEEVAWAAAGIFANSKKKRGIGVGGGSVGGIEARAYE